MRHTYVAVNNGLISYTSISGKTVVAEIYGDCIKLVKETSMPIRVFHVPYILFFSNRTLIAEGLYLNNTIFDKMITYFYADFFSSSLSRM